VAQWLRRIGGGGQAKTFGSALLQIEFGMVCHG
jgi:hypothetical protein